MRKLTIDIASDETLIIEIVGDKALGETVWFRYESTCDKDDYVPIEVSASAHIDGGVESICRAMKALTRGVAGAVDASP